MSSFLLIQVVLRIVFPPAERWPMFPWVGRPPYPCRNSPGSIGPARSLTRIRFRPAMYGCKTSSRPCCERAHADGSVFDLTDERGNVVVLFFMAAWCTTCIPEARALNALYEEYGDRGLPILAIDIDPRDTEPSANDAAATPERSPPKAEHK